MVLCQPSISALPCLQTYFVVMANLFCTPVQLHEKYDLKVNMHGHMTKGLKVQFKVARWWLEGARAVQDSRAQGSLIQGSLIQGSLVQGSLAYGSLVQVSYRGGGLCSGRVHCVCALMPTVQSSGFIMPLTPGMVQALKCRTETGTDSCFSLVTIPLPPHMHGCVLFPFSLRGLQPTQENVVGFTCYVV